MLQVYVLDVLSKAFVCFIQVFHVAHLSCCSESQGAHGLMVARRRHREMGCGELGTDERGARHDGVMWTGRARGRRSGHDGGGVRVQGGLNGLESRRIGQTTRVRRVSQTRGRCEERGARAGREKNQQTLALP